MLLVRPIHDPEFLAGNALGVELHINRDDVKAGFEKYIPFVHGIHLPYAGVNLAANDAACRAAGVEYIKKAVKKGCAYPVDRMVMHPCGILSAAGDGVGSYGFLIDSLREIADFMADKGVILCLENQVLRPPEQRIAVGCSSDEWLQLYADVQRKNVMLTFDSSHAASFAAHGETPEKRVAALWRFLEHPERIGRFHWSDARLAGGEARYNDMHLVPGKGDLPREFHQAILHHPAQKLLEQRCSAAEVAAGLEFIRQLG